MVTCKYCKREFKNANAYYAHKCEGYVKEQEEKKALKKEKENSYQFICDGCGRKFITASSLKSHFRFCEKHTREHYDKEGYYIPQSRYYNKNKKLYICECGKEFEKSQSFFAHLSHCETHHQKCGTARKKRPNEILKTMSWENKTEEEIKEIRNKRGKTYSDRQKKGIIKNAWKDKKHSEASKSKIRKAVIKYLSALNGNFRVNYNKNACKYIDALNEKKGWNLQHAENGGEFEFEGYFLDGYDKIRNIAFEYDEPRHYSDVYNNKLKEKDIYRQNFIIKKLGCKFYRYNEKLGLLYEI